VFSRCVRAATGILWRGRLSPLQTHFIANMTADNDQTNAVDQNPYASPREVAPVLTEPGRGIHDRAYRRAMRYAMIQQVVILVIASLVDDDGETLSIIIIASLLALVPTLIITHRQNRHSHRSVSVLDAVAIKYAFWAFFVGICILCHFDLWPSNFNFVNRLAQHRLPAITTE
jgi:hypothetical protein